MPDTSSPRRLSSDSRSYSAHDEWYDRLCAAEKRTVGYFKTHHPKVTAQLRSNGVFVSRLVLNDLEKLRPGRSDKELSPEILTELKARQDIRAKQRKACRRP